MKNKATKSKTSSLIKAPNSTKNKTDKGKSINFSVESPILKNPEENLNMEILHTEDNINNRNFSSEKIKKNVSNLKKSGAGNNNKKEVKRLKDLINDENNSKFSTTLDVDIDEIKNQIYNNMNVNGKNKDKNSGKKMDFKDFYGTNNSNNVISGFKGIKNSNVKKPNGKNAAKTYKDNIIGLLDNTKKKERKSKFYLIIYLFIYFIL